MERIQDWFMDVVDKTTPLKWKNVLEIGCGNGSRSVLLATRCNILTAIDPDLKSILFARKVAADKNIRNIHFELSVAQDLRYLDNSFDVVMFTLSLHHVPIPQMINAIDQAIRVVKNGGHVIVFEPTEEGSFFDAEIQFDACDGDERKQKKAAYDAIMTHPWIKNSIEIYDKTILRFNSIKDFKDTLSPKKDLKKLSWFLEKNDFHLDANRRINIFRVEK